MRVGDIPVLTAGEVMALPRRLGFEEARRRGSHRFFLHPDGRTTTVPVHRGRDISPVILRKIAADIGLTVEELLDARGRPR